MPLCSSLPARYSLAPPPPTLGAWFVLAFLALFLGLAHGALTALAAALLGRLLAARRWPRGFDALVALGLGTFYAGLGLSLWKYALARSHLRFEDLWFVFGSLRQLGDEGSAQERAILLATVALPLGLAIVFFVALRVARGRQRSSAGTGPVAALAAIALAALMVLCWRYPYARFVAGTQAPETSWVARRLTGGAAFGRSTEAHRKALSRPTRHAVRDSGPSRCRSTSGATTSSS